MGPEELGAVAVVVPLEERDRMPIAMTETAVGHLGHVGRVSASAHAQTGGVRCWNGRLSADPVPPCESHRLALDQAFLAMSLGRGVGGSPATALAEMVTHGSYMQVSVTPGGA